MTDARKYLVEAVRRAPDEVILDLVRSFLARGGANGSRRGVPDAPSAGTLGGLVFGDEHSFQPAGGSPVPLRLGTSGRLLRELARARANDEAGGSDRAGWRTTDELCAALGGITIDYLNVLAYRARSVLRRAGLRGDVIERRPRRRTLRLAIPPGQLMGLA